MQGDNNIVILFGTPRQGALHEQKQKISIRSNVWQGTKILLPKYMMLARRELLRN
jgi:hypothetical protein